MSRKKNYHALHYLLLASAAVFFLALLRVLAGNKDAQSAIIILFVFFYIVWGVFHHLHDRSLRFKVVLEYMLIGAIGLILLESLLLR